MKTYIKPNVDIVYIESSNIMAFSGEQLPQDTKDPFAYNPWSLGDMT